MEKRNTFGVFSDFTGPTLHITGRDIHIKVTGQVNEFSRMAFKIVFHLDKNDNRRKKKWQKMIF